jgi:hypothetical protein
MCKYYDTKVPCIRQLMSHIKTYDQEIYETKIGDSIKIIV